MLIDAMLSTNVDQARAEAAGYEAAGFDGLWLAETGFDPFLHAMQAVEATERSLVGTSVAIAFGRSPLTMAASGYDLARYSQGRFVLGIGSQVKAHIERRFSMPWSHPAARMREFVLAMRAIWSAWQDGTKLDFRGDFYTHTLMIPMFSPSSHEWGPPPVWLAGVGPKMTEVAGEVCDGFIFHPFTTPGYFAEVTVPTLLEGRARRGLTDLDGFGMTGLAFVTAGRTDEELEAAIRGTRRQIAFYASTPAYRGVLDHHGWGDLQTELTAMSKQGQWAEMGELIPDELLHAMSVVGDVDSVVTGVKDRWEGVATRLTLYATYRIDPTLVDELRQGLQAP